ncbi:MAG: SiaC family regulatory phosphoprotein [Flavobacteriales bacterium]
MARPWYQAPAHRPDRDSPGIDLDPCRGESPPWPFTSPNSEQFFGRVHRWLDEYLKQPKPTTVDIRMDYLDTEQQQHFYRTSSTGCTRPTSAVFR